MKLFFVGLLGLLLMMTTVLATSSVDVGIPTVLTTLCLNGDGQNANSATMRIVDQGGQEFLPTTSMFNISDGVFGENVTFSVEGTYTTQEICNFSGTLVTSGDTYVAKSSQTSIVNNVSEKVDTVRDIVSRPTLSLSGTDYQIGDNGTIFLSVTADLATISLTTCQVTAYYPNKTAEFNAPMTYLSNSGDVFYYDFLASNVTGVHIVDATCYTPFTNASVITLYGNVSNTNVLKNSTTTASSLPFGVGNLGSGIEVCLDGFDDASADFFGGTTMPQLQKVTNHTLYLSASAARTAQVTTHFVKHNLLTGVLTDFGNIANNFSLTTSVQPFNMSDFTTAQNFTSDERLQVQICLKNLGGGATFAFAYGGALTSSQFNRTVLALNESNAFSFSGSNELNIRDYGFLNNTVLLRQINSTTNRTLILTNDIATNVTSIKNDTSLLAQIFTWVQSIFGWVQTDQDQNATTALPTNVPQSVNFVQSQYLQLSASSVLAQVQKGGLPVTTATCWLNVYYPNMTQTITNGVMSSTGISGMYNYTWTPNTFGSHIAQVNCSADNLVGQVVGSGTLGVSAAQNSVVMQALS